ncbi:hut operon transcriptional regulator HutP [Domibacillus sp. DTU_2020_1001157_1_SI_ALB_TIR_016]|uniref:hut operon transcriptional regulator HutP n=1 Tax=Domibacillus sp. DTU_2020_1001157_1_SI_ALB_TIR_016 TaxID=3077789 RepID=UPI0028EA5460|nr:hut operon transcriptional regulator HutP [Domibacillus sp. DTU_2020_1001157_1_SI_ALB_TIR_016]WNS78245.1 hut operon transcriptional regulator HutP [Domibacillus sp. DTU_2020_1001157_1_SI_ALB_TIR_016]
MSYNDEKEFPLGKLTTLLALLHKSPAGHEIKKELTNRGYRFTVGRVGAMDLNKVIASIETNAKSNDIIDGESYREVHALYHSILEAVQGVGRGTVQFGEILRTVGLTYSIVRGEINSPGYSGEWISICIYGTIGAPKKGFEHDALGFGFNHI